MARFVQSATILEVKDIQASKLTLPSADSQRI